MHKLMINPTRLKVYELLVGIDKVHPGQHNQAEVSRILGISGSAVNKHKKALEEQSYIISVPNTNFFDRGVYANLIETKEVRRRLNGGLNPPGNPDAQTVDAPAPELTPFVPGLPAVLIEQDTLRAHMHGAVKYEVSKVGDHHTFVYGEETITFLETTPYNKHNRNAFYRGRLRLPGKSTVSVQLQSTSTKEYFYIWPPSVDLTKDEIEAGVDNYPEHFYEVDANEILNFIEKYAGWKFKRNAHGQYDGNVTGQVHYGLTNEYVNRMIPNGLKAISPEDEEGNVPLEPRVYVDRSPGDMELESRELRDAEAILNARKHFDSVDERLASLRGDIKAVDVEMAERELNLKKYIVNLYDTIEHLVVFENMDLKLRLATEAKHKGQKKLDDDQMFG